ncbi:MAG: hypothetical protein ABS76_34320 [Pelagibacterium sp. SCN 64-44]|nr:MAG: hypothetical protein ABS76_34320 [Pelagibacterium sp. SCN 64-44]
MQFRLVHWGLLVALIVTNSLTVAVLLRDTELVALWKAREQLIGAYSDRLAQLKLDVELLRSREILNSGNIAIHAQEIAEMQEQVEEQLGPILALTKKAVALGIVSVDAQIELRPVVGADGLEQLDILESELAVMERDLVAAVAFVSAAANRSAEAIAAELGSLGYASEAIDDGLGGPFLPAVESLEAFVDIANTLEALARFRNARNAMDDVPIHRPIATSRTSSDFGTRQDPFTGQSAFHSGIDFPAPTGTPIRSAGRGVVTFVGWKGDYGRVVEVTHPSGLVSRYPHLSKALVAEGDEVGAHIQIALVGSTGRSTGPHLHFEVRNQNGAIDPRPFLFAGDRLEAFDV